MPSRLKSEESSGKLQLVEREDMEDEEDLFKAFDKLEAENGKELIVTEKGKELVAKTGAKIDATYATEKGGKEVIEEAKTSGVENFLPDIEDMETSKECVGCPMKSKCKRKFNE